MPFAMGCPLGTTALRGTRPAAPDAPLEVTGAKLAATALYELRRRGGRYAVVTMCRAIG